VKWGEAVVDEAKYEEVAVQVGKEVKRAVAEYGVGGVGDDEG
jgi:hypothetical protein